MKKLLLSVCFGLCAQGIAFADSISDQVVANLQAQGFEVVQMDRTWLGRMWILARSETVQREVVFNPGTGEILRDYAIKISTLMAQQDQSDDHDSGGTVSAAGQGDDAVIKDDGNLSISDDGTDLGDVAPKVGNTKDQVVVEPINPLE